MLAVLLATTINEHSSGNKEKESQDETNLLSRRQIAPLLHASKQILIRFEDLHPILTRGDGDKLMAVLVKARTIEPCVCLVKHLTLRGYDLLVKQTKSSNQFWKRYLRIMLQNQSTEEYISPGTTVSFIIWWSYGLKSTVLVSLGLGR